MDFKHINDKSDKHKTPKSEVSILSQRLSHGVNTSNSPYRILPCFSTPPSRFAKILNPFEPHVIERLHLPIFSPNVFVQNSTPKSNQKFKWTIEDISSLKPADIDETTVSQHVCNTDDQVESLVQQKIDTFFSEKEIVPSPMNIKVDNVPLVKDCNSTIEETPPKVLVRETCEGATQTVLTLPPVLPKELEDVLKPYFTFNQDQQQCDEDDVMKNSSLYRQLFEFEDNDAKSVHSQGDVQSLLSSPAISTGLSPIQFSPCSRGLGSPFDMPELRDCNLSPITKNSPKTRLSRTASPLSRTVSPLEISDKMSVDASLIVPDMDNQQMSSISCFEADNGLSPVRPNETTFHDTTANWSMEYKQISIGSPSSSTNSDKMDVSNSNTPHSKIFTGKGQRKRLSESFKNEELEGNDNALQYDDLCMENRNKMFRNDLTDAGYQTQDTGELSNACTNVFASTPSKRISKIEF